MQQVVVVGAGPVGCSLALELARQGVKCTVLEEKLKESPNPKCNTISSSSMEFFRDLGLADKIRSSGLPKDYPADIAFVTSLFGGVEITRFHGRSSSQVLNRIFDSQAYDKDWNTPEPQHRVSQMMIEPILRSSVQNNNLITFRSGAKFLSLSQSHDRVAVTFVDIKSGKEEILETRFLVGCDGTKSKVRSQLGLRLSGRDLVTKFCSISFSCSTSLPMDIAPAWMYRIDNADFSAILISLNGSDKWILHCDIGPHGDPTAFDFDSFVKKALGVSICDLDVITKETWTARAVVSDHYHKDRVFLCGDAAHEWIPFGGFGMNVGIGDARNLAWKLCLALKDLAGPCLLQSYGQERRPIGKIVADSAAKLRELFFPVPVDNPLLIERSQRGDDFRNFVSKNLMLHNMQEFNTPGIQLGIPISTSDVIFKLDPINQPFSVSSYDDLCRPGRRLPHLWLSNGASLFDTLDSRTFSMIVFNSAAHDEALSKWVQEFKMYGISLCVICTTQFDHRFNCNLAVITRPDRIVSFYGDPFIQDKKEVVTTILGFKCSSKL